MSKKSFSATDVITTEFMNQFVQEVQIKGELSSAAEPVGYKEIPSLKAVSDKFATILETNGTTVKNATNAINATNVTTSINGKSLGTIFEEDGTTVKNATNVTTNINGKAITDIFNTDGTTVKNATKAEQDSSGNIITLIYVKKSDTIAATNISITNGSAFGNATSLQEALDYISRVFSGSQTVTKLCANTFDAK